MSWYELTFILFLLPFAIWFVAYISSWAWHRAKYRFLVSSFRKAPPDGEEDETESS